MESIGKQIGRLRQKAGVTQERLGAALGVLKELMGDRMIMDMPEYGEDIGWQDMYASVIQDEGAIWMKSMREDRYFFLAPEPKSGFGSMVENPEEYEKLFALLGTEGCMKVLIYLYANNGEQSPNCSARWVSEGVGLPEEQVAELLRALTGADLLDCQRVRVSRSEEMESYSLKISVGGAVLFLLLAARDCIIRPGVFAPQWEQRDFPLLVNGKEEAANEMAEGKTSIRGNGICRD